MYLKTLNNENFSRNLSSQTNQINWNQQNVSSTSSCKKYRSSDQKYIPSSCDPTIAPTELYSRTTTWYWGATDRSRSGGVTPSNTHDWHFQCHQDGSVIFRNDGGFFCVGKCWWCCSRKSRGTGHNCCRLLGRMRLLGQRCGMNLRMQW